MNIWEVQRIINTSCGDANDHHSSLWLTVFCGSILSCLIAFMQL